MNTLPPVESLVEVAVAEVGSDDFGDDTWQEGLHVLHESLNSEADLSAVGLIVLRAQIHQYLTNRLRISQWYTRNPEIDAVEVAQPVFSVGMVRTGTTALSFLLDQDPDNRSLLHWMAMSPCPPPETSHLRDDPRIASTAVAMGQTGMEGDSSMIELLPDGPAECLHLLSLDFKSGHFEGMARVPSYHDWLFAADLTPAYEWHRQSLKLLQWRAPTQRWMLKFPSHTIALDSIRTVYPEARFIVTHRDPAICIASVCSLVHTGTAAFSDTPDPLYLGRQWTAIVEEQLHRLIAAREQIGADVFFDVDHREMVRAPMDALERLYAWLGVEMTTVAREGFAARIRSNPKGVYGSHQYDPATYGLDVDELHACFRFYTDRFNVDLEERP